jgi:hypothetical protein
MTDKQNKPVNPLSQNDALPPLADPVVAAMFPDVKQAGLAAESLFGAILAEDKLFPDPHRDCPPRNECAYDGAQYAACNRHQHFGGGKSG